MKVMTACCIFLLSIASFAQPPADTMAIDAAVTPEPPMLGPHFVRGESSEAVKAARHGAGLASEAGPTYPDVIWHDGSILPAAATTAIFWGKKWGKSSFVSDKITGLDSWYEGFAHSGYAATVDEYTGTGTQQVEPLSTYQGHVIDTTSAPKSAPSTSTIEKEVCKVLGEHSKLLVSNGYYAVYVDTPRGSANYCAWHSWGSCNHKLIEFSFFFDLDGDPGCDPQDTSGLHSQGLAALVNVTGHELSEARSDPRGTAWFDSLGSEIGDKCAWAFGTPLLEFSNGTLWKIQGNWSNAHYNANNGSAYENESGEFGCIDGGNYLE
jgi:hypothetical protein